MILYSISSNAQLQWRALPSAVTNTNNQRFDDIFFINDTVGWAANGAFAAVYKTIDGGLTWTTQVTEATLGGNYYFRNIEFLNENIGFLGTLNGVVLKTIDGGEHWNPITNFSTNPAAICGLDAVGTATIYGCGAYFSPAYIIKSTDSGATWQYINMSAYATALVEIAFLDENIGYASGATSTGGVILKTTDGGTNWNPIYNTTVAGEYVWKLQILPSNSSVIFGSVEANEPNFGKMIRSTDSGLTWTSKQIPYASVQGIGFMTENHGWVGGYTATASVVFPILETTDGGDTWADIGVGSNLNRVFILSDNLAYASGATLYKYSDENLANPNFIENNRIPLKVKILPNPVKEKLNIAIEFTESDHIVIELYDSTGRFIKTFKVDTIESASTKNYTFDFPYASGSYLLNLHNDTGRQSIKFVK